MLTKLKSLGPGLLYAGAAIGVSHLVQSTKAGAQYGYTLIIAIVLAHLFKYPFFSIGPKYAQATGTSLVSGYAKMGKWAVMALALLTLSTMFTVQAAVTIVTAGLVQKMTGTDMSAPLICAGLLAICFIILLIGKFNLLDNLMKVIMVILSISTVGAFMLSFGIEHTPSLSDAAIFNIKNKQDLGFLLAFVGWMPAPLDIAVWHSIWALSAPKSVDKTQFDFKVGFYGTALLGICFVVLGANTMYGTGISIEASAGGFASQLLDAFTTALGAWSYWFIILAAFTTMFSTTLTCFDAMPRVMHHVVRELKPQLPNTTHIWRAILGTGALALLFLWASSMKEMVTLATVVSFLTAPFLALLSYRLAIIESKKHSLWNTTEKRLAIVGIVLLFLFSFQYIVYML